MITAIGCGLLLLLDEETTTPVWATILGVFGIGHGVLLTSVNVGIQAVSRPEDAGRAAAMYAFMRTLGMSIGVAIGGTVFQNVMSSKLNKLGLPETIAHNSEAFVKTMSLMDPDDPTRIAVLEACKLIVVPCGVLKLKPRRRPRRISRCLLDDHRGRDSVVLYQPDNQKTQHGQASRYQIRPTTWQNVPCLRQVLQPWPDRTSRNFTRPTPRLVTAAVQSFVDSCRGTISFRLGEHSDNRRENRRVEISRTGYQR